MDRTKTQPQIIIIGGANGSGKSTITKYMSSNIYVIDPDNIAKELSPNDVSQASVKAAKIAIKNMNDFVDQKNSFIVESTLSGKTHLRVLDRASKSGFKSTLIYIGLSDYRLNINRVKDRVLLGGHNIPKQDIKRRYQRSLDNLKIYYKKVDKVVILDNSKKMKKILHVEKNKIKYIASKTPSWLKKALGNELKILRAKEQEQKRENER